MFLGIPLNCWFYSFIIIVGVIGIGIGINYIVTIIKNHIMVVNKQKNVVKSGKGVEFMDRYFLEYYMGLHECDGVISNTLPNVKIVVNRHVYSIPMGDLMDAYIDVKTKRIKTFDDDMMLLYIRNALSSVKARIEV